MSTTINIRIDEELKAKAGKTLAAVGLDMSSAVKMFLNQVITDKGIPFVPTRKTKDALLREKWDREAEEAIKYGKRYNNAAEMFADILK